MSGLTNDTYAPVASVDEALILWDAGMLWYWWLHCTDRVYEPVHTSHCWHRRLSLRWVGNQVRQGKLVVKLEA